MALNIKKKTSPQDVDSFAKGDLIVNNGGDIISFSVGADRQIIIADSTTSEGIRWSDDKPIVAQEASLDNSIVTTWAGDGTPGLIDALYVQAGNNNPNPSLLTIGSTLGATNHGVLTDTSSNTPGVTFNSSNRETIIDLLGSTLSCTYASIQGGFNGNSVVFQVFGSNNGTSWNLLGTFPDSSGEIEIPITDSTPYSYFRFRTTTDSSWSIEEIDLYGTYISNTPSRSLIPADLNKVNYLNIGSGSTFNLTIPNSTSQWVQGDYYKFVNTGTGNVNIIAGGNVNLQGSTANLSNFTLVNLDGADQWLVIKDEGIEADKLSTKGDLLTYSTGDVILPVGSDDQVLLADSAEAAGIKWSALPSVALTIETKIDPGNIAFTSNGFNGIINAIGSKDGTEPYANPSPGSIVATGRVSTTLGLPADFLFDQDIVSGGAISLTTFGSGNPTEVFRVDFAQVEFIKPTQLSFYLTSDGSGGGTYTVRALRLQGSDDGNTWTTLAADLDIDGFSAGWYNIPVTLSTTENWRYLRLLWVSDDSNPGSGSSGLIREIELYGEYISSIPIGALEAGDLGKLLVASDAVNSYTLKVPDNNSTFIQGWYCYIKASTGNNKTIVSPVNVASIDAATNIPILNGPEQMGLLVNMDGADQWSFINIATSMGNPTTEQTADGTITLVTSDEGVQVIDPNGANRDVILPDPPSKDAYFKIVNSDAANFDLNIKETAAGSVVKTLDIDTPYVECHYTGSNWLILD